MMRVDFPDLRAGDVARGGRRVKERARGLGVARRTDSSNPEGTAALTVAVENPAIHATTMRPFEKLRTR